jgi:mRNA interferase MazF
MNLGSLKWNEAVMELKKGDVYFSPFYEDENEIIHPCVVYELIDDDKIAICMISTNMKKAYWPGNIVLNDYEAGLPKRSIVVISKTKIIERTKLKEYVGRFGVMRVEEIIKEIKKLNESIESSKAR